MKPEEWTRLEDQAHWLMVHPDQAPPREPLRGMALQFRLWQFPLSERHVSWSLILPVREFRGRRGILREVAWDRAADWKRAMSPLKSLKRRQLQAPSVVLRDAEVDWADVAPFLESAGGLPMAALGKDPSMPSEEDTSGFEGYRSLAHIRLEWTGKGPRGWAETIAWFARFRRLLLRVMSEREPGHA